jgi:hypothetical protein
MKKPVQIDVLTPMPEGWGMCQTCELFISQAGMNDAPDQRINDSFPQEWQEEFKKTSHFILDMAEKFGSSIQMILYDPRSLQGIIKAIRFRVHRYPAFIINNKTRYIGVDPEEIEKKIINAGGVVQVPE